MTKQVGRPPKPKTSRRINILRIRLLGSERRKINAVAKKYGLDTSTWARTILLTEAEKSLTKE